MTTDYTYRAVETFNKCREIIQGFTAKYIVENILRTKYRVLKAKGLENIEKANITVEDIINLAAIQFYVNYGKISQDDILRHVSTEIKKYI